MNARAIAWGLVVALVPILAAAETLDVPSPKPCQTDADCHDSSYGSFCDPDTMYCGNCFEDADCGPDAICSTGKCVVECTDALDCTSQQPLCDADLGYCVACGDAADCPQDEHCEKTWCIPDVCTAGTRQCWTAGSLDSVRACAADGGAWQNEQTCAPGQVCVVMDSGPQCVDEPEPATTSSTEETGLGPGTGTLTSTSGGGQMSGGPEAGVADRGCTCRAQHDRSDPSWLALFVFVCTSRRRRA